MNKMTLAISSLIFLLCMLFLSTSTTQADPSLYIAEYSLDPEVYHPGDTGILTVTITNGETTSTHTDTDYINSHVVDQTTNTVGAVIDDVSISSDGDGSYRIYAEEIYRDIVELAPGASITLEFTLLSDENISDGIYTPFVNIDLESSEYQDVSFPIIVKVSNETIDVISEEVPSTISSIGGTDLSFLLFNHRINTITDITITPALDDSYDITPSKQHIETLDGISSESISFSLIPKDTSDQMITLSCSYKNGDNIHSEIFSFPVNISTFHEVYPIMYAYPEIIHKGETEEIRLKIYNAKNEEISGVRITPKTAAKVTPNEYFIGSMDADDLYAVTFEVNVDHLDENQTYPIEYEVTFKQDANVYSTVPVVTEFTVSSSNGANGSEYLMGFAVVVVILLSVVLFFMYRKKRA